MKTRILQLTAIILIAFAFTVHAQQDTTVSQAAFKPQLGSFEIDHTNSPFSVNGKNMNIQQINGTLMLPLVNNFHDGKLDFLLTGISYSGLFLSGTGAEFGGTQFHSFSVPLIFQKSFSPKYALIISVIPTLSSDLKDISGDDMLYSATAMLKVRKSEKFSYSVGLAYSHQFFGTVVFPIIGVDWNISDKLSLSGSLPVSEKLKYQVSNKSAIGINTDFGIGGGSYRLSAKMKSAYFQVQQVKTGLFYEYAISKRFSVQASGGYNFMQQLDLYDKNQVVNWPPFNNLNKRVPQSELKKTGFAVQTGLNYRF